jgi:hypothetical protein
LPTILHFPAIRRYLLSAFILAAFAFAGRSQAQVVLTKSPVIGSSNPVTAEPLVPRPPTRRCTVPLFTNQEFADYSAKTFKYAPPPDCPGPWSKVVFTADFTVTQGVQYDRTASIYLGHSNIYYGTTSEPGSNLSPSWHVERDVTDLSTLFASPQSGEADIYNIVNSTYTGIIYANAKLQFYVATDANPAPVTPDIVVPLPDASGGAAQLNTTASQLAQTVTLPTNVERVYLDVIAQSQQGDEFWYTCVPSNVTGPLESCGNTAFRETEISIDGTPAGVAPVYPWIYTGGIDPYLWIPITGVQTLDFKPYRVDLTPFASLFSDGKSHVVGLSVFNANGYFLATANLLAYTDKGTDAVTGRVTVNTLSAAPDPKVTQDLNLDSSGNGTATVSVTSARKFDISGYVNTSHGLVVTTVAQNVNFLNDQKFTLSASEYIQAITQSTTVYKSTTTKSNSGTVVDTTTDLYPFSITINVQVAADGSETQTTTSDQTYGVYARTGASGEVPLYSETEEVKTTDTLNFDSSGNFTGPTGTTSSATDSQWSVKDGGYYRGLTSTDGVLTGITYKP